MESDFSFTTVVKDNRATEQGRGSDFLKNDNTEKILTHFPLERERTIFPLFEGEMRQGATVSGIPFNPPFLKGDTGGF
jgi:hypothetical protein